MGMSSPGLVLALLLTANSQTKAEGEGIETALEPVRGQQSDLLVTGVTNQFSVCLA